MTARTWTLTIDWCGRPISANDWSGNHWRAKAALVKLWRGYGLRAAQIARLPRGLDGFDIAIQYRYSKGQLTDADAAAPCSKAIIDGLIDYGLCPDDKPRWFHGTRLLPAYHDRSLPDAVIVRVTEVVDREPVRLAAS